MSHSADSDFHGGGREWCTWVLGDGRNRWWCFMCCTCVFAYMCAFFWARVRAYFLWVSVYFLTFLLAICRCFLLISCTFPCILGFLVQQHGAFCRFSSGISYGGGGWEWPLGDRGTRWKPYHGGWGVGGCQDPAEFPRGYNCCAHSVPFSVNRSGTRVVGDWRFSHIQRRS